MTKPKKIKKEIDAWGILSPREDLLLIGISDTRSEAEQYCDTLGAMSDFYKVAPIKITYYTNGKS